MNGCFSTAQSLVVDNRPQVDLGADLTICEDNATATLNAQNPGANFQWRVDGVNASTIQTQAVDTSNPGVFTYEVTVTDPVTTCTITDEKIYTVNVSPAFALSGINPAGVGTPTGSITLQLNASDHQQGLILISLPGLIVLTNKALINLHLQRLVLLAARLLVLFPRLLLIRFRAAQFQVHWVLLMQPLQPLH